MGSIVFALFKRGSGKTKLILIVGVIAACFLFKINPLSLLGFSSGGGGGGTEMVQNPIKRHSITSPPYRPTMRTFGTNSYPNTASDIARQKW